jgi:hypothetical protein
VSRAKLFLLSVLFLAGCSPRSTSAVPPIQTGVPETAPSTLEQGPEEPTGGGDGEFTIPTSVPTPVIPEGVPKGWRATYTQFYFDDFESAEERGSTIETPGLRIEGNASLTVGEAIDGERSIVLSDPSTIQSMLTKMPLQPNTTYLFEYDYRVIHRGSGDVILWNEFRPEGPYDPNTRISARMMLSNVEEIGTFSGGAMMGEALNYALFIISTHEASIVIDNLTMYRLDVIPVTEQPLEWVKLANLPYPRLGNYSKVDTTILVTDSPAIGVPFAYTVNEIEARLALSDVIIGPATRNTHSDPDFTRRLREMNPDLVILPIRIFAEQGGNNLQSDFGTGVSEEWIVKDTNGNPVIDPVWNMYQMDVSPYAPLVNGRVFNDFHIDWIVHTVMGSGVWDGIFIDNMFGSINPHIPNAKDPSLFNYDLNRNGEQDETPAMVSEIFRAAAIQFLDGIREQVGDLEIVMGNAGPYPERYLAPYVNGYLFECWNYAWESDFPPRKSEEGWRRALDEYDVLQADSMVPKTNIMQGCGGLGIGQAEGERLEAASRDIQEHRFTLGTALLGDGFYEYDLWAFWSAPYWFDEYTVDGSGKAVEDPAYKGYLGHALAEALELTSQANLLWEEDFEDGSMPIAIWIEGGVYVSQTVEDVIDGAGSLVIDNPQHTTDTGSAAGTRTGMIQFQPGETYVVEFDWKILDTVDNPAVTTFERSNGRLDGYFWPGVVAGDLGRAKFHTTLDQAAPYFLVFELSRGGGKVAIDNIKITRGGAGPWRRDFENGFVLVNPLNKPYTFTMEELRGDLGRTGIKRILGTQAPEVNNGQSVDESLTLQPFDAIILLADRIHQ